MTLRRLRTLRLQFGKHHCFHHARQLPERRFRCSCHGIRSPALGRMQTLAPLSAQARQFGLAHPQLRRGSIVHSKSLP
jgi:hypothetical protein